MAFAIKAEISDRCAKMWMPATQANEAPPSFGRLCAGTTSVFDAAYVENALSTHPGIGTSPTSFGTL
jgi:hypothetical protein